MLARPSATRGEGEDYYLALVISKRAFIRVRRSRVLRPLHDLRRWRAARSSRRRDRHLRSLPRDAVVEIAGYNVRINDGPNLAVLRKDLFEKRIYAFNPATEEPVIIDGGANIGMSVLFFKHAYPNARIRAYEPDPGVYPYLEENVARNDLPDVVLERAAIGAASGSATFYADNLYTSHLEGYEAPLYHDREWNPVSVPVHRLRDLLEEPIDLLKLNIEGAETDALLDAGEKIRAVRELIVEYHHIPGLPRTLHDILSLLHENGFEYLVNSFDQESSPGAQPPFKLDETTMYYLLVYGRRLD
jgi:FkbM family methyltransferase